MPRQVLKLLNGVYDLVVGAMVLSTLLFSAYSIWDNAQIYRSAAGVQDSIRQYRPVAEDGGQVLGFDELRAINKDVIAWLTLEGTNIDYPVLQGKDNLEYMNKDVFGDTSLAGSIFLDTRCNPAFKDRYSLIYGHNMDEHLMFGDLALYKDKKFFAEHPNGEILTPDGKQEYQVAAVLQISAGTEQIFNPETWKDGFQHLPEFLEQNSLWYRSKLLKLIEAKPWGTQVVALVTCSDGSTNDRTVLILVREHPDWRSSDEHETELPRKLRAYGKDLDEPSQGGGGSRTGSKTSGNGTRPDGTGPKPTGDGQDPVFWYRLIGGIVVFIALFETADRFVRRHREEL